MQTAYDFKAIQSIDQWRRSSHYDTQVDKTLGAILLAPREVLECNQPLPTNQDSSCKEMPAPMAFDSGCRLYQAIPECGQIYRWHWSIGKGQKEIEKEAVALVENRRMQPGDFKWQDGTQTVLDCPSGIVIDADDRLFVSDTGHDRIHVFDLTDHRLLRSIPLPAGSHPAAMAVSMRTVYVITTTGLIKFTASSDPVPVPVAEDINKINHIAANNSQVVAITDAGTEQAAIVLLSAVEKKFHVPFATNLKFVSQTNLVVARGCSEELLNFELFPLHWQSRPRLYERLKAKGYDGRGFVRTPEGVIGYFSKQGFRKAFAVKPRFLTRGKVVTFALDSGVPQNQWGIAYLDACLPSGCDVRIRFLSADQLPEYNQLPRQKPGNDNEYPDLSYPELSPSMPDELDIEDFTGDDALPGLPIFRRGTENELAWSQNSDNKMVIYECPVQAQPGRYLWLILELTGTGKSTPAIASLRVQKTGHELLRHLPVLYSREAQSADFLKRYLSIPDSLLSYFDSAAFFRHTLLDPASCPEELLPWLSAFVGLVLDERFNESTRRELISKAIWLFRFRGTVQGLRTFLEIYLRVSVVFIEHFKVRGLGGALVGGGEPEPGNAILGVGMRVGLTLGTEQTTVADDQEAEAEVLADPQAHRFTVVIAAILSTEEMQVVRYILKLHRPAHTLFEVCTVEAGMRIGRGMHLQLTTLIGSSSVFQSTQINRSVLGRGNMLGYPRTGSTIGNGVLDNNARLS